MQYKYFGEHEDLDEGWLVYCYSSTSVPGKVGVFIPASWGNKHAALKVMQAGLAGLMMPEGHYRIVNGSGEEVAEAINKTNCMLLGLPFGTSMENQAIIEFSSQVNQARETWGELIASRMRAHVAQPG